VLPFSREQLEKAKHDFELKKDGRLYVHIDERMAGVGSHACGPKLADEYRVKGKGRIRVLIHF
jgi:beta-galactosidase